MASTIYQVVESNRMYVDQIFSPEQDKCFDALVQLKNSVIGSNKQKSAVIQLGVVPRLIRILSDEQSTPKLLVETAVILGSLAKGTDDHVRALVEAGVIPALLNGTRCVLEHHCAMNYKMVRYRPSSEEVVVQRLTHPCQRYVEACLRCLRTIFASPSAPIGVLYQDSNIVPHLIHLIPQSTYNQECITTILTNCCQTAEQQNILCSSGAIQALAALLCSPIYKVQMPSLSCLAQMCHKNEKVSSVVATSSFGGKSVPDILVDLLARDKPNEMQLAASKCLTYICRAGAISAEDPKILFKTLSCLVRMCKKDKLSDERITAAETLAYLINVDTELQRVASISDHLIASLTEFLKYQPDPPLSVNSSGSSVVNFTQMKKIDQEVKIAQNIKQAAFKAFASLGANDEDIRKRIIDTDSLMDHIVSGLSDGDVNVRLTAIRCLHSLSRSVQQLRTTFQDHTVWKPLMQLLHGAQDDILIVASSTLCNLLLEFSPSKEPILESGAVDLLCGLTCREDPSLRLNGIWALMNMAFQAEQKIKSQILNTLGTDQIFRLLSDSDVNVLMKTLGLLRNLLSTKPHIDHIMGLHGKQIMQAVILILEGDHAAEVKEQSLCILANIADGDSAKNFIMSNEDVLKKLASYMMHRNIKLQIAATFCICNLSWNEENGALERQIKLRELGVQKLLQQMLATTDTILFDKVKTALQQFA